MRKLNVGMAAIVVLTIAWSLQASQAMVFDPERVTVEQLNSMLNEDADVVVIDTRSQSSFEAGHIPGALSISFGDELRDRQEELPRNKTIIFY